MKISRQKFAIATSNFPLEFDDGDGNKVDSIEEAYFYNDKEDANAVLNGYFDEPDKFQIIDVMVTYEF